jgi:hypothetical protein
VKIKYCFILFKDNIWELHVDAGVDILTVQSIL